MIIDWNYIGLLFIKVAVVLYVLFCFALYLWGMQFINQQNEFWNDVDEYIENRRSK